MYHELEVGGKTSLSYFGLFFSNCCHSDETLSNMFSFPVHEDICDQFYGFVCFPLHNPLLYSSCFSLGGFLPVSRSRIFTPLKCHLLLIFLGCDASRPSIARSFLSFRALLKCHLFSKALHGSPHQKSFVSPATQTALLSLATSSS